MSNCCATVSVCNCSVVTGVGVGDGDGVGDGNSAATRTVAPDQMIIHWHGRFYDGALRLIDPTSLASAGHRVLAIAPDLSITEAMGVREMIAIADLEVTTLDTRWIQNLEERDP